MPTRIATIETRIAVRQIIAEHLGAKRFVRTLDPARYDWVRIESLMSNAELLKSISLESENELRSAIGLEPLPRLDERPVCPIHGVVHDTECDGEQGAAVWVHPKEKLVKAPGFGKPRAPRKTIQLPPEAYAIMVEWKERIGGDWYETIRAMDYLARGVTR